MSDALEAALARRERAAFTARANVDEVLKRLPCIAPTPPRAGAPLQEAYSSVQKGVLHLVEAAINPKNLSRMEPTWAAWL